MKRARGIAAGTVAAAGATIGLGSGLAAVFFFPATAGLTIAVGELLILGPIAAMSLAIWKGLGPFRGIGRLAKKIGRRGEPREEPPEREGEIERRTPDPPPPVREAPIITMEHEYPNPPGQPTPQNESEWSRQFWRVDPASLKEWVAWTLRQEGQWGIDSSWRFLGAWELSAGNNRLEFNRQLFLQVAYLKTLNDIAQAFETGTTSEETNRRAKWLAEHMGIPLETLWQQFVDLATEKRATAAVLPEPDSYLPPPPRSYQGRILNSPLLPPEHPGHQPSTIGVWHMRTRGQVDPAWRDWVGTQESVLLDGVPVPASPILSASDPELKEYIKVYFKADYLITLDKMYRGGREVDRRITDVDGRITWLAYQIGMPEDMLRDIFERDVRHLEGPLAPPPHSYLVPPPRFYGGLRVEPPAADEREVA
jgi:hypothetical protein